jgi:DNA-3-methyladenine glycosylase II
MTTMHLEITGPYDLAEVAMMGFGHRDERQFDGVMRLAFCVDGDYERPVGVAVRQDGETVELTVETAGDPLTVDETEAVRRQVARVISLDHDGEAFHQLCLADPALAGVHSRAPGFRPSNFYSPYEALVWSVISARRARPQGIGLRTKLAEAYGTAFDVAGVRTLAVPTPSRLLEVQALPGLPADRVPRLHAVAEAAQQGRLSVERLRALPPDDAKAELQKLPGIGPFYSALVVVRALGHADVLSLDESHSREAVQELYGIDHELTDTELTEIAEGWRPFRTWVTVMLRALSGR